MSQRISIRRVTFFAVAVALLAGAIFFGVQTWQLDREFREWAAARPVVASVDLSEPGQFTAPFRQTCCVSHGEAFYLTVPPTGEDSLNTAALLEGLHGKITITDPHGAKLESLEITEESVGGEHPIMLAYFRPFDNGDYTVTIDVGSGAPNLAGMDQVVHAEYHLCGLERAPSMINGLITLALGVPAVIMMSKAAVWFCEREA